MTDLIILCPEGTILKTILVMIHLYRVVLKILPTSYLAFNVLRSCFLYIILIKCFVP